MSYNLSKVFGHMISKNPFHPKLVYDSMPVSCLEGVATSHGPVCVMHFVAPCGLFSISKLKLQFCGTSGLLYPQRLSSPELLLCLDSNVYTYALYIGLSAVQRFLVISKLVGAGWSEVRMTLFIAEIPHSNSCHLHYCQINSELLPIIHCLAWGKWNGGFASVAEMRVVQPSEEPCRVAKEMSNIIWSQCVVTVLSGAVLALYTLSPLHT